MSEMHHIAWKIGKQGKVVFFAIEIFAVRIREIPRFPSRIFYIKQLGFDLLSSTNHNLTLLSTGSFENVTDYSLSVICFAIIHVLIA